jgi:hypothetical protein
MTPKEKAEELVDRMLNEQSFSNELYDAKQCALIAVDEIQKTKAIYVNDIEYDYWEQVKHEINNL